jgi:steroid delta-isomerase-like uncharacterized protein
MAAAAVPDVTTALETFGEAYLAAWNSHDEARLLAFLHPEIVYDDAAWPVTMRGHDDVRTFLRFAWRAFPDLRFEILDGPFRLGADKAAWRWRGRGTMTGPVDPPRFAPTGRPWSLDGVDVHEYRDGRVARLRIVFDAADLSRQVGLLPAPGSRAERAMAAAQRFAARLRRR